MESENDKQSEWRERELGIPLVPRPPTVLLLIMIALSFYLMQSPTHCLRLLTVCVSVTRLQDTQNPLSFSFNTSIAILHFAAFPFITLSGTRTSLF